MLGMRLCTLGLLLGLVSTPLLADDAPETSRSALRRPVALAVQGSRLFVANQSSGSLSTIDPIARRVVGATVLGERLSDLVRLDEKRWLLATDEHAHNLILIDAADAARPTAAARLDGSRFPVRVVVGDGGTWGAVSSLWSRRLTLFHVERHEGVTPTLRVSRTVDLDFAPRALQVLPARVQPVTSPAGSEKHSSDQQGERLLVADAFGGQMIVVDPRSGATTNSLTVGGHHLRGLAIHAGTSSAAMPYASLLIAHQTLNSNTSTTHEHVFWGGVIGNRLRAIELTEVLEGKRREAAPGSVEVLGRPSAAAGDPGAVVVTKSGATVIALSGIDEVAVRRRPEDVFSERSVGRRPTAVALSTDEKTAYIANTFDDSISFLDLETLNVGKPLPLGPMPKPTLAMRGEELFYDSRMSLDGWYSCHSCHTDGHTNGLLNDNLGDEYFGAPKKILSLLGTAETSPWAWNGGAASLEAQLRKSLAVTMQSDGDNITEENIAALKASLTTLTPPPGIDVARGMVDLATVARGQSVFRKQSCADCHAPATYTTPGTFDVGIHDERGTKAFNPPSLRGVSQRAPYFHDNRAATLSDVFGRFKHGLKGELSDADRADLVAFLRSL
ncbi:MAG TPA: cytochrome c peroxidase [Planctomycetaceae bacterium]|nr:cytochrome c peroxidase [Planctomycetaceae bacterium]